MPGSIKLKMRRDYIISKWILTSKNGDMHEKKIRAIFAKNF
jgi:hypothetical protein